MNQGGGRVVILGERARWRLDISMDIHHTRANLPAGSLG